MNKEEVKKKIEEFVYYREFARQGFVQVLNLKLTKTKAICDVKHTSDDGEVIERYNNCEYNLEQLNNNKKEAK